MQEVIFDFEIPITESDEAREAIMGIAEKMKKTGIEIEVRVESKKDKVHFFINAKPLTEAHEDFLNQFIMKIDERFGGER